jgi:transcription initiation factor IIE alpha subunit
MEKDEKNAKLWTVVKETEFQFKLNFVEEVEQQFQCTTCMELVHEPVTLDCTHNICKNCLQRAFKSEYYECPYCRADLKELKDTEPEINKALSEALTTICPGYGSARPT